MLWNRLLVENENQRQKQQRMVSDMPPKTKIGASCVEEVGRIIFLALLVQI